MDRFDCLNKKEMLIRKLWLCSHFIYYAGAVILLGNFLDSLSPDKSQLSGGLKYFIAIGFAAPFFLTTYQCAYVKGGNVWLTGRIIMSILKILFISAICIKFYIDFGHVDFIPMCCIIFLVFYASSCLILRGVNRKVQKFIKENPSLDTLEIIML